MQLPKHSHILDDAVFGVIEPFSTVAESLAQVQSVIIEQLSCSPQTAGIEQMLGHIRSRSGKMLRPGLVLLSGLCCGKIGPEHIQVAAIFEIIHEATLLHDDVIDDADKRRGQYALNKLYGNESAVLLGDFLLSRVFGMSADLPSDIAKEIASAAGRTCQGELNQNLQKKNWQLNEDQYIEIITDKTAAIFGSCCQIGAQLGGADENMSQRIGSYGLNLGIAFQIVDDVLDIIGDEEKAGKTLGTDLSATKPTLPLIHLLGSVSESKRKEIIDIVDSGEQNAGSTLSTMFTDNGCLEYSRACVRRYIDEAIKALESVPESTARTALIETAEFVASRVA